MQSAELRAARRAYRNEHDYALGDVVPDDAHPCPDCGVTRRTPETLRVHRKLAHDAS